MIKKVEESPPPSPEAPEPEPEPEEGTGIETEREQEGINVFKAVLDADAGSDTYEDPQDVFDRFISFLSEAELERMDRRIRRMCKRLLKGAELLRVKETYGLFKDTMDHHLQASLHEQVALQERVQDKLVQLGVKNVQFSAKGKVLRIFIGDRWYSMRKFIKYFFLKEMDEVQKMVDEGVIVRKSARHTGRYFITKAIEGSMKLIDIASEGGS